MRVYEFVGNIIGRIACLVVAVILLLGGIVNFIRTGKWENPYVYQEGLYPPPRGREE